MAEQIKKIEAWAYKRAMPAEKRVQRKLKGVCRVKLNDGTVLNAEVHWYEGHGIGKKEIKIKRYL